MNESLLTIILYILCSSDMVTSKKIEIANEIKSICDYLVSPNGTIQIYGNKTGCNSQAEVEAACAVISVENITNDKAFLIYPNPSSSHMIIEISANPAKGRLSIFKINGEEIITCKITGLKTILDMSNLPCGVYFVRLMGETSVEMAKLIKQ